MCRSDDPVVLVSPVGVHSHPTVEQVVIEELEGFRRPRLSLLAEMGAFGGVYACYADGDLRKNRAVIK